MNIKALNMGTSNIQSPFLSSPKTEESSKVFEDFYNAAIGMVRETNTLQKEADQIQLDFVMGKTDNIPNVMLAQEKASIALQFTIEIRNQVLEAYREIMRMPL